MSILSCRLETCVDRFVVDIVNLVFESFRAVLPPAKNRRRLERMELSRYVRENLVEVAQRCVVPRRWEEPAPHIPCTSPEVAPVVPPIGIIQNFHKSETHRYPHIFKLESERTYVMAGRVFPAGPEVAPVEKSTPARKTKPREIPVSPLGTLLRVYRVSHHLTQSQVAAEVGATRGYIALLEQGRLRAGSEMSTRISRKFHLGV